MNNNKIPAKYCKKKAKKTQQKYKQKQKQKRDKRDLFSNNTDISHRVGFGQDLSGHFGNDFKTNE